MTNKYTQFTLLTIENINWDDFYNEYLYVIQDINISRIITKNKNIEILKSKYDFVVDLILRKTTIKKDFNLNAELLYKTIGVEGKDIIDVLKRLKYIGYEKAHIVGKTSTTYKLSEKIIIKEINNFYDYKIYQYKIKNDSLLNEYIEKKINNAKETLGNTFYNNYVNSLKQLRLTKQSEALTYIHNKKYNSSESKEYYLHIIDKYKNINNNNKHITTDPNKRIYSILTKTPRDLKQYLNIKFSIDCNNSHPLLFSYFLIKKYNINSSHIESFYCSYDNFHNSLDINLLNNIPIDVLDYINLTFTGNFWKRFLELNTSLDKKELKEKIFEEVYYSKKLTYRWGEYALYFKKQFPTVFGHIMDARKNHKEKKKTHLSNTMMSLESDIFHVILKRLYAKKIICLNIHDAIVILDIEKNKNVTCEEVELIMKETFREYNLVPTFDIEPKTAIAVDMSSSNVIITP